MSRSFAERELATEGNDVAPSFQGRADLESAGKSVALDCLNQAIDASLVQRKVLAAECGWTEGQFSKVASGKQGDPFDLAYRLPPHRASIRADFFGRLAESEGADPVEQATEQLAVAAVRWLRAKAAKRVPEKADRMARVDLPNEEKARTA